MGRAVQTLGALRHATNTAAVTSFIEERILPGSGLVLASARRRGVRLEAPDDYWAVYRIRLVPERAVEELIGTEAVAPGIQELPEPNAAEGDSPPPAPLDRDGAISQLADDESVRIDLRLSARGKFDPEAWDRYVAALNGLYGDAPCDPIGDIGYPVIFPETQHAFWFYPVDPALTGLIQASDAKAMKRFFRADRRNLVGDVRIRDVEVEMVRWLPEIAAIIRYTIHTDPAEATRVIYGKVQHSNRGRETDRVMRAISRAAERGGDHIRVPRSLGYHGELGLLLQEEVPGTAISSDRLQPEFLEVSEAAAEALVAIQESGVTSGRTISLESDLARLSEARDQFANVDPRGHFLLDELLRHIRARIDRTPEEDLEPTHGDLKYDQFLNDNGSFTLIDFDYFGIAETSYDLGKYSSHLVPSMPPDWRASAAAEEARTLFIQHYRRLRPDAHLQRFPIYEALNLALRAMVLMWSQMRDWERSAEFMLALAMERLNTRHP